MVSFVDLQFEKGTAFRLGGDDLLKSSAGALIVAKTQDVALAGFFATKQAFAAQGGDRVESLA